MPIQAAGSAGNLSHIQRVALCRLVGYCEGLVRDGLLFAPDIETALRLRIAEANAAFGLPTAFENDARLADLAGEPV